MSLKEHIEGLKNGFGRTFKKCLSLILCLCVLTSVVSGIAGCQLIDDLKGLNGTNNYLSETELARLIANAINSEDAVADSYAKIPSNQLDGLSYSVFYEYCSILRKASKVHGTADSLVSVDYSERLCRQYKNAKLIRFPGQEHGFTEPFITEMAGVCTAAMRTNVS